MNQTSNVLETKNNHQTADERINKIISANPDAFTHRALMTLRQEQVGRHGAILQKERQMKRGGFTVSSARLLTPEPMGLSTSGTRTRFGNWVIHTNPSDKDFAVRLINATTLGAEHHPTLLRRLTELHTSRASYDSWRRMVMSQFDEALPAIINHLKAVRKGQIFHSFTCTSKSEKLMRRIDGIEVRGGFAFLVL